MPDRTRDLHWTWFVAGAAAALVLLLSTRRGRHWISDRIIDAGLWLQSDIDNTDIEEMLTEWGREQRQHQRRRRNGRPPGPGYGGP